MKHSSESFFKPKSKKSVQDANPFSDYLKYMKKHNDFPLLTICKSDSTGGLKQRMKLHKGEFNPEFDKQMALACACRQNAFKVTKSLITKWDTKPNIKHMAIAMSKGNLEIVKLLIPFLSRHDLLNLIGCARDARNQISSDITHFLFQHYCSKTRLSTLIRNTMSSEPSITIEMVQGYLLGLFDSLKYLFQLRSIMPKDTMSVIAYFSLLLQTNLPALSDQYPAKTDAYHRERQGYQYT